MIVSLANAPGRVPECHDRPARDRPTHPRTRLTGTVIDQCLLFVGDSPVAGVGHPAGLGWVGRVDAASFGAGTPLTA